jgi:3-phenylpropionate/cinnamic acid dioxygenase small subunit
VRAVTVIEGGFMARVRWQVAIGLVSCLVVAGWVVYAQTNTRKALTAQDYSEITELYARLYQGSDLREMQTWISNFAEDAIFRFPDGKEVAGKKALADFREKSFGGQTGDSKRRHWVSGVMLTPNADGTTNGRAYWFMIDARSKQPVVAQSGYFHDVFVKTSEGWKFKRHGVYMDGMAE